MKEKIETQKFIINRLDTYVESSQNKSNLYLTLNTIIDGGIVALISVKTSSCTLNIVLALIALLSVISTIITLRAINPYSKGSLGKKSIFFFEDISKNNQDEYYKMIAEQKDKELLKDITGQTYSISKGLSFKYKLLKTVGWIVGFEFVLLFVWIIIYLLKS